jgi:hypothetical protein
MDDSKQDHHAAAQISIGACKFESRKRKARPAHWPVSREYDGATECACIRKTVGCVAFGKEEF